MNKKYMPPILDYAPPKMIDQVYEYIRDNPRCGRTDIARRVGLSTSTLNSYLSGLRYAGRIRRYSDPTERKNGVRWEIGREEGLGQDDPKIGVPKQTTVSTWKPATVRDPLLDAFYGRQA